MRHFSIIKLFIAFLMMLCCGTAMASDFVTVDGFKFLVDTDKDEATLLANDYKGKIVVPETVTYGGIQVPVVAIADKCFYLSAITEITLPSTIVSLGEECFQSCKELKEISIPENVREIGKSCFCGCKNLVSVKLPEGLKCISSLSFSNCECLKNVNIPSSVERLEDQCFAFAGIKDVVLPNSVTNIEEYAFAYSAITKITIPNSVVELGRGCFTRCYNLVELEIPASVSVWGIGSFSNCEQLEAVNIKVSLEELPWGTFGDCASLKIVTLPPSLRKINGLAFSGCSSLGSIVVPASVSMIDAQAFSGCDKLDKIQCLASNPPQIWSTAFDSPASKILYVPKASLSNYKKAEIWKEFGAIEALDESAKPEEITLCSTPILQYAQGNLSFESSTPGAEYHYTINDADVATDKYNTDGEVQLNGKLDISVYATADGYKASDKATATLYWLNAEGGDDTDNINLVKTKGVMVTMDNDIAISGLNDGEVVTFYTVGGVNLGSAKAVQGVLHFDKPNESIVIAKIKGDDLKIAIK